MVLKLLTTVILKRGQGNYEQPIRIRVHIWKLLEESEKRIGAPAQTPNFLKYFGQSLKYFVLSFVGNKEAIKRHANAT